MPRKEHKCEACGGKRDRRSRRCYRCFDRGRNEDTRARWGISILLGIITAVRNAAREVEQAGCVISKSSRLARTSIGSEWWKGDMALERRRSPGLMPTTTGPRSLDSARDRAVRVFALRGDVVLSGTRGTVLRRESRGHLVAAQPQEGAQR